MSSGEGPARPNSRIAVVGAGQVGGAAAFALVLGSVASELLLVDVKADLRDAQVRDLTDVAYSVNSGTRVRAATHREAGQCDVVVLTAGSRYSTGETNTQHMYRNVGVVRSCMRAMTPFRPDTIVLVVANPVDLLTSIAQELSGLPKFQVFGSGTFLDEVRLRGLLADKAEVAANSVHVSVLGMHSEAQVVAWSTATIHGVPVDEFLGDGHGALDRAAVAHDCRHRSESIVRAKGAIPFGIGACVSSMCASILLDRGDVRPVSHFQPEFGCCFSLPVVLGRKGILRTVRVPLDDGEQAEIARSAGKAAEMLQRIKGSQSAQ